MVLRSYSIKRLNQQEWPYVLMAIIRAKEPPDEINAQGRHLFPAFFPPKFGLIVPQFGDNLDR